MLLEVQGIPDPILPDQKLNPVLLLIIHFGAAVDVESTVAVRGI